MSSTLFLVLFPCLLDPVAVTQKYLYYSWQLFHFDVHEDVRTIADATIEKDEVWIPIAHPCSPS